jgi:hypothetical protein
MDLIPSVHIDPIEELLNSSMGTKSNEKVVKKLGYVWEPDIIPLSYSRLNTLHSCPRKFLLKELNQNKSHFISIDTSYGSAFGTGVQELFRSNSIERAVVAALGAWDYPEMEDLYGKKKDKSFWSCAQALHKFYESEFQVLFDEYELAYIQGKSGIELFVYIHFESSYSYQVHIDLILQNRASGALAVAEIKTSGKAQTPAMWGNAEQTLGYYAILETLCKRYNLPMEPRVLYITQNTSKLDDPYSNFGFHTFRFEKESANSANFIISTLTSIEVIEVYIKNAFFPKRGNSCEAYGRPCEFFGLCDMEHLIQAANQNTIYESLTRDDCDFILDFNEMLGDVQNE